MLCLIGSEHDASVPQYVGRKIRNIADHLSEDGHEQV